MSNGVMSLLGASVFLALLCIQALILPQGLGFVASFPAAGRGHTSAPASAVDLVVHLAGTLGKGCGLVCTCHVDFGSWLSREKSAKVDIDQYVCPMVGTSEIQLGGVLTFPSPWMMACSAAPGSFPVSDWVFAAFDILFEKGRGAKSWVLLLWYVSEGSCLCDRSLV
jgi:hypothetical protein